MYKPQIFAQYDGRKGSAIEHVSKFIDTLGSYAADKDLCIREFLNHYVTVCILGTLV